MATVSSFVDLTEVSTFSFNFAFIGVALSTEIWSYYDICDIASDYDFCWERYSVRKLNSQNVVTFFSETKVLVLVVVKRLKSGTFLALNYVLVWESRSILRRFWDVESSNSKNCISSRTDFFGWKNLYWGTVLAWNTSFYSSSSADKDRRSYFEARISVWRSKGINLVFGWALCRAEFI